MPTTQRRAAQVEAPSTEDTEEAPSFSEVDVALMLKQLQETARKQQEHINALLAEKGLPTDPVDAQIKALQAHVSYQANANPWHSDSYVDLKSHVDSLTSEALTVKQAAKAARLVDRLAAKHPGHELAYVKQLAQDLHDMTLDAEDDE